MGSALCLRPSPVMQRVFVSLIFTVSIASSQSIGLPTWAVMWTISHVRVCVCAGAGMKLVALLLFSRL